MREVFSPFSDPDRDSESSEPGSSHTRTRIRASLLAVSHTHAHGYQHTRSHAPVIRRLQPVLPPAHRAPVGSMTGSRLAQDVRHCPNSQSGYAPPSNTPAQRAFESRTSRDAAAASPRRQHGQLPLPGKGALSPRTRTRTRTAYTDSDSRLRPYPHTTCLSPPCTDVFYTHAHQHMHALALPSSSGCSSPYRPRRARQHAA